MKKMLVLLIVVAAVGTAAIALAAMPGTVDYETKMGTVSFDHDAHKAQGCKSCHHSGMKACKTCHGVDDSAPSAKDAYHQTCIDCHKEKSMGPTKCTECHVK